MLLAKLFYSQARIDEASKILNTMKLQKTLNEQIKHLKQQQQQDKQSGLSKLYSLRELQIYAEAHCVRGLCLESRRHNHRQSISSPNDAESTTTENEALIIDSFEVASKFAIEHSLMVNQRMSPASQGSPVGAGVQPGMGVNVGSVSLGPNSGGSTAAMVQTGSAGVDLSPVALASSDDNLMDLINPLYEIALQKAPILYIKKGYCIFIVYGIDLVL